MRYWVDENKRENLILISLGSLFILSGMVLVLTTYPNEILSMSPSAMALSSIGFILSVSIGVLLLFSGAADDFSKKVIIHDEDKKVIK
jgi:hypothetical protein